MFKVIIVGGENTGNYKFFCEKCIQCLKNKAKEGGITILSTGDKFVDKFAQTYGIDVQYFFADWKRDKKNALQVRAMQMVENCDAIITFNDGIKDNQMLNKFAIEAGKPSRLIALAQA